MRIMSRDRPGVKRSLQVSRIFFLDTVKCFDAIVDVKSNFLILSAQKLKVF